MNEPFYLDPVAGITIYHGDSTLIVPTLGPVDHVITDPPYNAETHKGARAGNIRTSGETNRRLDIDFEHVTPETLRAFFGLVQVRRWVVASMAYQHTVAMEEEPPAGLEFIRFGIWRKHDATPQFTGDRPGMGWEAVCIMHPPGKKRWNGGGHHAFWEYGLATKAQPRTYKHRSLNPSDDERRQHPTEKPIGLLREWIEQFTDPGDLILDPFMGSGTTLRAAKDLGRRAIGIDLEQQWCEMAVRRLSQEVFAL